MGVLGLGDHKQWRRRINRGGRTGLLGGFKKIIFAAEMIAGGKTKFPLDQYTEF